MNWIAFFTVIDLSLFVSGFVSWIYSVDSSHSDTIRRGQVMAILLLVPACLLAAVLVGIQTK